MSAKEEAVKGHVLQDFAMNQVHLTGEFHINAFAKELDYLHSYDLDRLLAGFRENRGLPPKAGKYPGWEDTEIRGHTLGHFMTACAQAYEQTSDPDLLKKLEYIIAELAQCQFESGYLSAFPESLIDNIEKRQPAWVPWYTIHKLIAGLIAVYQGTQLADAKRIVCKLGDWVALRTSRWSHELQTIVLSVEYGGMNDCLYDLFKISSDPKHLEAAHKFDEIPLFKAIAQGADILKGKHANTTIPKFLGALNRYRTLGESEKFYLEAAKKFWDIVVNHHTYITGGNSESEHFGEPDILDARRSDITCETCNSYNMLKLTRELFKLTGDKKYADYYETSYINAILSSQNPETGMTMYFQPMATGYFKIYSSPFEHFWCCTGTGMESFTKLNDSIYFYNDNELYVNQFISSRLDFAQENMSITQTASIPDRDDVQFTIETTDGRDRAMKLYVRVPNWVKGEMTVLLNGKRFEPEIKNEYLEVDRTWHSGDVLDLVLPMKVLACSLPDNPAAVGFQYGPIVLSAALGNEDMTLSSTGIMVQVPTKRMRIKDFIIPNGMTPKEWIQSVEEHVVKDEDRMEFRLRNTDEDERLIFTPHYKQHKERYGIYWNMVEPDSEELKRHLELGRLENLTKEATIDSVQVGNDQYELQHGIRGENTFSGAWDGQNGRLANDKGWFSYTMAVDPDDVNVLQVTYFLINHNRAMNIYVNDQLLAREETGYERRREFVTKEYPIPQALINKSSQIVVKFMPEADLNGIYGVLRTMRPLNKEA
ncbi:beta-L-arabinofuranosidase domain-containing protein [Paenibacillus shunpengii]|uniref:Beta-L-arabinofuranosidase domain-containing protein n=2 Tax=Paenibacillus TaxID=44249 RepID=A0ABW5SRB9_9BACL